MISKSLHEYVKLKENQLKEASHIRVDEIYRAVKSYYRTDADADYSRILYSSSYRRLQGKMQLLVPKSQVFYRNRLTHSSEVAQFAKTIAKRLKLKDTITVQACSLAHDIGNPPFGHAGEIFLNKVSEEVRYEGNAQTFRTLRRLEERHFKFNGLNLTRRTMLGVVKYFKPEYEENQFDIKKKVMNKKFLYNEDYTEVKGWFDNYEIDHKTIDCEIMDLADEIAFAIHDLEDTLKLNYFTIDELLYEFKIDTKFNNVLSTFTDNINVAREFASKAIRYKTSEEYAMLFTKELVSLLSNSFVKDIDLVNGELGYKRLGNLVQGLKEFTFKCIKRQPDIIEYEQLGKHVLTKLFDLYTDRSYNKEMLLMPANYRNTDLWERKVLDYLGGMMDVYAIQQYEKYFGSLSGKGIYL